ncbi:Nn.00g089650.m01.CDS01 [Neocucurbitaria sp. VM-36]
MTSYRTPFRQIRAHQTAATITVYQAYNNEIADAAVKNQRLNASPKFSTTRMTWIKPSWAWMLYRSGYSHKDRGQDRILALTLRKEAFVKLLRKSVVASSHGGKKADSVAEVKHEDQQERAHVRVQWDPERTVRLEKLAYRSIQIGVPGALINEMIEGIVEIADVTGRARALKQTLDKEEAVGIAELVSRGLVPEEREFEVDEELRETLNMDEDAQFDVS